MELDQSMHKIQGVLKNQQRILGTLNTLSKENQEDISKVVSSLKKVIEDEEINNKIKQKLFILLFLNLDSEIFGELKKNRKCAHLVGFFPKLSQDLFLHITLSVNLNEYLYESVQFFCNPLSYKLSDMCLSALTWMDLFEALGFVENMLVSLFSKIVTIEESDSYNMYLKDVFQRFLLHYDSEKGGSIKRMQLWKRSKLKHYAGCLTASLFNLLTECTNIFLKKDTECEASEEAMYNIKIDEEAVKTKPATLIGNRTFTVQQCYEHIVAKCYENVCAITIDLWLFWVEIDLDDIPDTENTLQRMVGENAFVCRNVLQEAECAGVSCKEASDLILKLKNIALEPQSEEDQIKSMDLGEILANIQDPSNDTTKWLKFLLTNQKFAVEQSSLEVIQKHMNCLETSQLVKLSSFIFEYILSENSTEHKRFILDMMNSLDINTQTEVSKAFLGICGLSSVLKTEDFHEVLVETFNKVINEDEREKELYRKFMMLAIQDAITVVHRAVVEGVTSEVRGHIMAAVLSRLQPFCDTSPLPSCNSLLITALDQLLTDLPNLPENQHANYPLFVRELVMRKNLQGEKFIRCCLMVKLHQQYQEKDWIILKACLETLSELIDINCECYCAASLIMLVNCLEACRWQPATFNMAAESVCELAIQLIDQVVTRWIEIGCKDEDVTRMLQLVGQNSKLMNRLHLSRLMTDERLPVDPALSLVYRMHFGIGEWSILSLTDSERTALIYALCYVLPVMSAAEWKELFCVTAPKCSEFLALFHIVTDTILVCLDSAKISSQPVVMNCLNYALINIAQAVKCEANRWTKDDNEYRVSVLNKLCEVVASFPLTHQETFGLTLVKVFDEWNKSELDSFLIEITRDILKFKDSDGQYLVEKIRDSAGQKGTGKWTAIAALDYGIPVTLIGESVFSRCLSSLITERAEASKVLPGPANTKFSGDKKQFLNDIKQALYASKIISYAQGFMLMREAAKLYNWKLNYGGIALMWRGGCIIRSVFLGNIKTAFDKNPKLTNLLLDPFFRDAVGKSQASWRRVVAQAATLGVPTPAFSTALAFYDGYRCKQLPANLLQAQRDYFGAHTYELLSSPGLFIHTNWTGHGGNVSASTYQA